MTDADDEHYSGELAPAESEDLTRISDEVLSTIAGVELSKIEGVSPPGGGIADFLARKSPSKGIKIETSGDQIAVEVAIIVEYGVSIPEIASEIQTRVRKAITEMTGKFVSAVNISVQGIRTKLEKHEKPHENLSLDDKPEE